MVLPTVGWALLHQLVVKTMPPPDMPTGKSDLGNSSFEIPSSQVTLGCVKLTVEADITVPRFT